MFEQKQDSGKSASLAEKYANAVAQLSDSNDRAARAEHDLQVERKTSYACLKIGNDNAAVQRYCFV